MLNRGLLAGALLVACAAVIQAQAAGPADAALARQVDSIANQVLQSTGVPSASVAVVKNGRLAYANAYGAARLEPRVTATPEMRYAIGCMHQFGKSGFTKKPTESFAAQRRYLLS